MRQNGKEGEFWVNCYLFVKCYAFLLPGGGGNFSLYFMLNFLITLSYSLDNAFMDIDFMNT